MWYRSRKTSSTQEFTLQNPWHPQHEVETASRTTLRHRGQVCAVIHKKFFFELLRSFLDRLLVYEEFCVIYLSFALFIRRIPPLPLNKNTNRARNIKNILCNFRFTLIIIYVIISHFQNLRKSQTRQTRPGKQRKWAEFRFLFTPP